MTTRWRISQIFNEDRSLGAQIFDDVGVMHDLVSDVDGRTELRQCALHDFDRTIDTCTKASRLGQQNFFFHDFSLQVLPRLKHTDDANFKFYGLTRQRMIKVKQGISLSYLEQNARKLSTTGCCKIHQIADRIGMVRIRIFLQRR